MKFAILILTFNRLDAVRECFDSLASVLARGDVEIHILDNNSTDGTAEYVCGLSLGGVWRGDYRILSQLFTENLGVAGGRNRLLKEVSKGADCIVFLDSDTVIIDPNWLDRLGKFLDDHEDVGLVGPGGSFVLPDFSQFTAAQPDAPCDVVAGFCQCFRAELLDMGLHIDTEHYPNFWAEDSDFCMQVRELGWDCFCLPVGIEHHSSHSGFGQDMTLHAEHLATFRQRWQGKGLTKAEGAY